MLDPPIETPKPRTPHPATTVRHQTPPTPKPPEKPWGKQKKTNDFLVGMKSNPKPTKTKKGNIYRTPDPHLPLHVGVLEDTNGEGKPANPAPGWSRLQVARDLL